MGKTRGTGGVRRQREREIESKNRVEEEGLGLGMGALQDVWIAYGQANTEHGARAE